MATKRTRDPLGNGLRRLVGPCGMLGVHRRSGCYGQLALLPCPSPVLAGVSPGGVGHAWAVSKGRHLGSGRREPASSAHGTRIVTSRRPEGPGPYGRQGTPRRRRGRIVLAVLALAVIVLLAVGGVCGMRLYRSAQSVRREAQSVLDSMDVLKDAVKDGNEELLRQVATEVNISAHYIASEVNTRLWDAAAHIPTYGEDVQSVQELAAVLVDLSDNALSPMVSNFAYALNLKNLLQDGAINIEALRGLITALQMASPIITRAADRIEMLPEAHIDQLSDALGKVKEKVVTAGDALERAQEVIPYLPAMFGADGQTRNYLLVALNNAELRSAGGFPGSWSLLTITDGRIELAGSATLQGQPDDFLDFQPDELETFPIIVGNAGSIPLTPNFPRAGLLMASLYTHYMGTGIDGTFAVDPVFLQRLLALTGGVTASDGTFVDGGNAARVLMSEVYWRYGEQPELQDAFFAEVAGLAFSQLTHGLGSVGIKDLITTVFDSAAEHRFQVWMANADEQALMGRLGLTSAVSEDASRPVLGVYLNDNTWSKMSWYVRLETALGEVVGDDAGGTTYDVVTTITNTATPEELAAAPSYVYGDNEAKRSQSDMCVLPLLLAPAGGSITDIAISGQGGMGEHTLYGLDAWFGWANVEAQEALTLSYKVHVPPGAEDALAVWQTPTAQEW